MEMDIACLHSEVEDCESIRTISRNRFSSVAHYEIMHVVSSYLFLPGTDLCRQSGQEKRIRSSYKIGLPDQRTKIKHGRKQKQRLDIINSHT